MGDVVNINDAKPHMRGPATCTGCNHSWEAVVEIGEKVLECPECHCMKGLFRYHVSPRADYVWQCSCGCDVFYILLDPFELQCIECGSLHDQDEID